MPVRRREPELMQNLAGVLPTPEGGSAVTMPSEVSRLARPGRQPPWPANPSGRPLSAWSATWPAASARTGGPRDESRPSPLDGKTATVPDPAGPAIVSRRCHGRSSTVAIRTALVCRYGWPARRRMVRVWCQAWVTSATLGVNPLSADPSAVDRVLAADKLDVGGPAGIVGR